MQELIDLSSFDSDKLKINIPSQNEDGQFSKITYNNCPIFIQTPISSTKQGFIKNGKKITCDLMFKSMETEFLHWLEQLETTIQKLLFTKGEDWFEQKLEMSDIESLFTTPTKLYKSGKYYLLRVLLKEPIKIFKENDNIIDLTYSDITQESNIISIIEIKGVKYTNKDFHLYIEIKQIMIVQPDPFLTNCFIKTTPKSIKPIHSEQTEISNKAKLGQKEVGLNVDDMVNNLLDSKNSINTIKINMDLNDLNDLNENIVEEPQLKEIDLDILDLEEPLKEITVSPNETTELKLSTTEDFYEKYKIAKQEAKEAKEKAVLACLKLDEMRRKYNIDSDEEN